MFWIRHCRTVLARAPCCKLSRPYTMNFVGLERRSKFSTRFSLSFLPRQNVHLHQRRLQNTRFNYTVPASSANSIFRVRFDEDGNDLYLQDSDVKAIYERIKEGWPAADPSNVPPGWSCDWESWPYLFTYYWLGPFYLLLPQIEMFANIQYRIPGEMRPILFSTKKNAFFFTPVGDGKHLFYLDVGAESGEVVMWRVHRDAVKDEHELLRMMNEEGGEVRVMHLMTRMEPDEEGADAIRRILARDETVIPVLAEKFLDYTPVKSMEWEELGYREQIEMSEEEELEVLAEITDLIEKNARENALSDETEEEEGDLAEEEEDVASDELEEELDAALHNLDLLRDADMNKLEKLAAEEDERERQKLKKDDAPRN